MNVTASRMHVEEAVLATLCRRPDRLREIIDRLDLEAFQIDVNRRLAKTLIDCYRTFGTLLRRAVELRLDELHPPADEEGQRVFARIVEAERLPETLDLLEVLAGRQEIPPPETKPPAEGSCLPMTQFAAGPREWLWPGRLELGQLTLIGGAPASGKSLVACDVAARITVGRGWPDGGGAVRGTVLFVASADDVSRLFRPRLQAAGADIGRAHVFAAAPPRSAPKPGERSPFKRLLKSLEESLSTLEECRLVVVDPLLLSVGRAQTTIAGDPAASLELLAALARRRRVAVLGVSSAAYEDRRRSNLAVWLQMNCLIWVSATGTRGGCCIGRNRWPA